MGYTNIGISNRKRRAPLHMAPLYKKLHLSGVCLLLCIRNASKQGSRGERSGVGGQGWEVRCERSGVRGQGWEVRGGHREMAHHGWKGEELILHLPQVVHRKDLLVEIGRAHV